jgi:hypothetical protein
VQPPLRGAIKGDLQSLDGAEHRYCYYLRPDGKRAIPQWLANFSAAARDLDDLDVFVVVTEVSATLERSCRAAGVGLLRLTDEDTFEMVVSPSEAAALAAVAQVTETAKDARRRMENKLELNLNAISDNFSKVNEITAGMTSQRRDHYIEAVEQASARWTEWGERISTMIDEAAATGDQDLLNAAIRLIEEGAEGAEAA